jgi:hypothetical protein
VSAIREGIHATIQRADAKALSRYVRSDTLDNVSGGRTEEQIQGAVALAHALNRRMFSPLWSVLGLPPRCPKRQGRRKSIHVPSFLGEFKLFSILSDTFFLLSAD